MLPGVLWTQTAIPALVWWYSCQSERNKLIKKTNKHGETEGKKKSRMSVVRPGVSFFFPLKTNKSNRSDAWPGLLGPLLRRGVRGGDRGNLLCVGQQSGIWGLWRDRQSITEWGPQRRGHCPGGMRKSHIRRTGLVSLPLKQFCLAFLNKSFEYHSKVFYDVGHGCPHHPPPSRYPHKWIEKSAPENASLKL